MADQYSFSDPRTLYPNVSPPTQLQDEPGIQSEMTPVPDLGEDTYRGTGRLQGRKALITGADSGIGGAVAIAFAREGADITMSYMPAEESDADHVAKYIEEAGQKVVRVPGDLRNADYPQELVAKAVEGMGGLDIVVNVAGKQIWEPDVEKLSMEQFKETFQVNVFAPFEIIQAAVPHLPPGSTVINTASMEAYKPGPERLDYAATKGAINNLSKGLSLGLIEKGIRVNVIAPGPTWSALQVSHGIDPKTFPEFGSSEAPLGRAAQPAEQAPAYVFLASAESSFVVGATLAVSGGMNTP